MKKRLASLLSVLLIFVLCISNVYAQQTEKDNSKSLMTKDFNLTIKIPESFGEFEKCTLRFNLYLNDEKQTWLSNRYVDVSSSGTVRINFPIGEYEVGTEFILVATTGLESYTYYGSEHKLKEKCYIGTYAYRDENRELVICNGAFIEITSIPTITQQAISKEKHVNEQKIWSDTSYLVWVSKANFTVNVFLRDKGKWNLIKEFPCSIGAPSTPTITGQYVYHQYQNKWQYNGYYVGPIMRFYRGYALHSTLVNDDGTDRDGRVGKQISHGCVRLRPDDIKWLVNYVPLKTKIYLTDF